MGDYILVDGRHGVVAMDLRPEHSFAKVRWTDNGETSDVISLAEIRLADGAKNGDADSQNDVVSTAVSASEAARPMLTVSEEKEARKLGKTLREITKLEERIAAGDKLDPLQMAKIA